MCIGVCISVETLYDVVQRPHLRQVLRMLPEQVQQEIYSPTADNNAIRIFTSNNFKMLQGKIETEAVLYIGVHGRSRAWYVGRTSAGRCRGKKAWNGPAVRWMEHFTANFIRILGQTLRKSRDVEKAWTMDFGCAGDSSWLLFPWFETICKMGKYGEQRVLRLSEGTHVPTSTT